MERGLQEVNYYNQLSEWAQRVEVCRKSGQWVSEWCLEQGITVSTYYNWQRKVYQAVTAESEVCFTEISARPASRGTAAIQSAWPGPAAFSVPAHRHISIRPSAQ